MITERIAHQRCAKTLCAQASCASTSTGIFLENMAAQETHLGMKKEHNLDACGENAAKGGGHGKSS